MEESEYRTKERIALLVSLIMASLSLASLLVAFSYYCYIRNKVSKRSKLQQRLDNDDHTGYSNSTIDVACAKGLQLFPFKQLQSATGGFSKSNVIGKGAFGSVYRGVLIDGRKVAIKLMDQAGKQGEEEFKAEVELLSGLRSPYLLGLIGYCSDSNHRLLVYEFMANGGLQEHLYGIRGMTQEQMERMLELQAERMDSLQIMLEALLQKKKPNNESDGEESSSCREGQTKTDRDIKLDIPEFNGSNVFRPKLDWETRLRIALDSAKGLEYLHEHVNPPVIHRDFKSSNILLDRNFHAKVSDFGLAKLGPEKAGTHVSTRVLGTQGYVAPEYALTGHLTTKSDVYSYGVVLLELLTGRVPVDMDRPQGEGFLVSWALPHLTDRERVLKIMDPTLEGRYSMKEVIQVSAIAAMCVQPEADYRPLMADVVQSLVPLVKLQRATSKAGSCSSYHAPKSPTALDGKNNTDDTLLTEP